MGMSVFKSVATLDISVRQVLRADFGKWSWLLTKQIILQGACDFDAPEFEPAAH